MNKVEKKHFKLFANYHSKNAGSLNYMQLFDIIEKQKEYNEQKIMSRLKGVKKAHLPALKYYLYHLVLESLRVIRNKGDEIDSKLKNMLENAYIMRDKGLAEEELKFIKSTKELAIRHERYGVLLDVLLMEGRKTRIVKKVEEIEGEIESIHIKIRNLLEYMKLASKMSMYYNKSEIQRDAKNEPLQKMLLHPNMRYFDRALSIEAKMKFYNSTIRGLCFIGDYRKADKIASECMQFIESNYLAIILPNENYSSVLNNLSIIQHNLGKHKELLQTIEKHRTLVNKSGMPSMNPFAYSYINETHHYITTGEFEKGAAIIRDIEKESDKLKTKIPDSLMLILIGNISLIYFGAGEYRKSLFWVNKIINHPKISSREDMQGWTRILQILIHYELNTPAILPHLLVSTYRFLLKRKLLYKVEEGMLQFIRRLSKTDDIRYRNSAGHKALLENFGKFRNDLIKITKDPEERKTLYYFDLISWLESKIENRPFSEVVREKALNNK
jgi:hypothetical protein